MYIKNLISFSTKRNLLLNSGKKFFFSSSNSLNTLQKKTPNLINYNCKCLECSIPSFKNSSYTFNKDKQNIVLQVCKKILSAIQLEHNRAELFYDRNSLTHENIINYHDIKKFIDHEFKDLINSNKLFYEKYNQIFKWSIYKDVSIQEHRLKSQLIQNLSTYLPGFKYLYTFEWNYVLNKPHYGQGDFIFASDSGVFCVVEVKHMKTITGSTARKARNLARKVVGLQALKYKMLALKKFEKQQITVISAIFINGLNWDMNENDVQLIFVNDIDKKIAQVIGKKYKKDLKKLKSDYGIFPYGLAIGFTSIIITYLYFHLRLENDDK
ncbi:12986_t:CDS:2 [Dentiscutata heterogama]|uniref:12986_t:CDS:1 n=1 Tax=Dentiscutata heterogama TaxID=1316150 RepID=A0ACA9JWK6_9GLOM|nr:12986_t:CDS:2 [Dentiscutata heterogama]